MYKLLSISVFFIFSTSVLSAQQSKPILDKKNKFGIRVGYNNVSVKDEFVLYSQSSPYIGLLYERKLKGKFSFQLETTYSYTDAFDLIEIPLLFKYEVLRKVNIYAGVQLDVGINSGNSFFTSDNNGLGASFVLGTEYEINKHFHLELRYIHGISNQFDVSNVNQINPSSKKRGLNIGIGYKF